MANGKNDPTNQFVKKSDPQNRSRMVIEPSEDSGDAEAQRAARDVEIQQRGGYEHDRIKIDPFGKGYSKRHRNSPLEQT